MKKNLIVFSILALLPLQSSYALQAASFIVEVNPATASVNQAVDVTVKAIDSNGAVVKDYNHNVFIEAPSVKDPLDVTLPNDGVYTFAPSDQWVKVFSKGLSIKTPGTYTIEVSDIESDSIKWQASITIQAWNAQSATLQKITFSSPLPNSTETTNNIAVVGNASVKNATVEFQLDGAKVQEGKTNANGDFSIYLTDVAVGQHTLPATVKDIEWTLIAQSDAVTFTYQPSAIWDILSFEVLPSKTLKQGQKATFVMKLQEDAISAELEIIDAAGKTQKLPLDKGKWWVFQKQLLMDVAGTFTVNAAYAIPDKKEEKANIATLSVLEGKAITEVKSIPNPSKPTQVDLFWKSIGNVDYVLVKYGKEEGALTDSVVLTWSSGSIQWINVTESKYFARLFPSDAQGTIIGEPSDVILIEQVQWSAPVCRVQGIVVNTEKIGDKYFITWNPVEWAERYMVYYSDRPTNTISDMQYMGEVSAIEKPRREYDYDPHATKDAYKYFAVVAVCQDGSTLQVGGARKVKVGPATNILFVFLFSLMVYGIYRMRKIEESA
jgi:hypothetical protein